ncbi:hypothetical protein M513_11482 [Trichuris suis]|uniref:Microtubule-associated protein Jupiter n=1 Tax=Trichuris suis TaxID=68888 RepID=A0A085LRM3_9BILA|nr:hypothetical protein M513_11482 [Trichuris suis]
MFSKTFHCTLRCRTSFEDVQTMQGTINPQFSLSMNLDPSRFFKPSSRRHFPAFLRICFTQLLLPSGKASQTILNQSLPTFTKEQVLHPSRATFYFMLSLPAKTFKVLQGLCNTSRFFLNRAQATDNYQSSGIFSARSADIHLTPRRVKNYQQSHIFDSAEMERKVIIKLRLPLRMSTSLMLGAHRFIKSFNLMGKSPASAMSTQDRLFGSSEPSPQRRGRISDTYRSSIFSGSTEQESTPNNSSTENAKLDDSVVINGNENGDVEAEVDGGEKVLEENGAETVSRETASGKEIKSSAGANGQIAANDTNSNMKNCTPTKQRVRQPPGGFSSGLW